VSFANPLMTKMCNQEVVGNSSNLWEFLKAEFYFHKVLLKCCCFLFFFGQRSLTRAFPCCTRQNLVEVEPTPLISSFRIHVLSFPQEETWGSDDGLKS